MADKIDGILKNSEGHQFFAVGSNHLPGDLGIIELMKQKGWVFRKM